MIRRILDHKPESTIIVFSTVLQRQKSSIFFTFTAYLSTKSKISTTLSPSEIVGTVFGCMILLVAVVWFSVFTYLKYTRPVRNRQIADVPRKSILSEGFMMDTLILNSQRYSNSLSS